VWELGVLTIGLEHFGLSQNPGKLTGD
jgi:hypothetical protein